MLFTLQPYFYSNLPENNDVVMFQFLVSRYLRLLAFSSPNSYNFRKILTAAVLTFDKLCCAISVHLVNSHYSMC